MSGAFDIGVSAMLASQRQLATTSHNIANVNTAGYSRQQVELNQRPPQFIGTGFLGKGVDVSSVTRSTSEFLSAQVRSSSASEAKAVTFSDLAKQVDALVGDGTFGPALQRFFQTLQDANNEPASTPARQVFVIAAKSLTSQVQDIDHRFDGLSDNINNDIRHRVTQLNTYTTALANSNRDIVQAYGISQGQPPNDLLDQRDQILKDISKLANVTTVEMADHSLNVFIGNSELVVASDTSVRLSTTANPLDGGKLEVSKTGGSGSTVISDSITSGSLAGIFAFRDEVLNPSRNALGRLAAGLSFTANSQHHAGLDLRGALGGDLFSLGAPVVNGVLGNGSTVTLALDPANIGKLTDSDYDLIHDGTNFLLKRKTDGVIQTLSGAGPFTVDGLTITVSGVPTTSDQFLLQPTRFLSRSFGALISDPLKVALASPVKSSANLTNLSAAKISPPKVLDAQDSNLLVPTTLVFNTPPTTFQINGAGPLIPYTAGSNVDLNGWRIQITGAPTAGDTFRIDPNGNGRGDNTNGLLLADLRTSQPLLGGTASYQDAFSQLVSKVGAQAQQAQISGDALKVQLDNAEASRDSVAGVNLDEEAANLIRFQQAFQAAAQLIQATNETFKALIAATR